MPPGPHSLGDPALAQLLGRAAGPRQHPGVHTTTVPHPVHCRRIRVTVTASQRGPENSRSGCAGDPSHPFTLHLRGQCLGKDAKRATAIRQVAGPTVLLQPVPPAPSILEDTVLAGDLPTPGTSRCSVSRPAHRGFQLIGLSNPTLSGPKLGIR